MDHHVTSWLKFETRKCFKVRFVKPEGELDKEENHSHEVSINNK